jgi:integrase
MNMKIKEQWPRYLEGLKSRKRHPVKPATLKTYESHWNNWIRPELGKLDISAVDNGVMRSFIAKLSKADLAPTSIQSIFNVAKGLISSVVDENGNEIYPRKWNAEFIDAPEVKKQSLKAPTVPVSVLETALSNALDDESALYATLAGTGLRISEALGIKVDRDDGKGSFWIPEVSKIVIRDQFTRFGHGATKTAAGVREVDLAPELNDFLRTHAPTNGYLFGGDQPLPYSSIEKKAVQDGIPGFHSLRRFRITYLASKGVNDGLAHFWTGHAAANIHETYMKFENEIIARRQEAARVGLGFKLPEGK